MVVKTVRLAVTVSLLVLALGGTAGALTAWPQYTRAQLQDPAFVSAEIQKYAALRADCEGKRAAAADMHRMALDADLYRLGVILDGLRYVAARGYDPADPGLREHAYFLSKTYPSLPVADRDNGEPKPEPASVVYELSQKDLVAPLPLATPDVEIPPELAEVKGVVKARFTIDEKGTPTDFHIIGGVTPAVDRLVEQNILASWRYQPATLKGQPVKVYFRVMVAINQRPAAPATPPPAAPPQP
jgi:hypothetical protein